MCRNCNSLHDLTDLGEAARHIAARVAADRPVVIDNVRTHNEAIDVSRNSYDHIPDCNPYSDVDFDIMDHVNHSLFSADGYAYWFFCQTHRLFNIPLADQTIDYVPDCNVYCDIDFDVQCLFLTVTDDVLNMRRQLCEVGTPYMPFNSIDNINHNYDYVPDCNPYADLDFDLVNGVITSRYMPYTLSRGCEQANGTWVDDDRAEGLVAAMPPVDEEVEIDGEVEEEEEDEDMCDCSDCGESVPQDEIRTIRAGGNRYNEYANVCEECFDQSHTCQHCEETYLSDENFEQVYTNADGYTRARHQTEHWCSQCVSHDAYKCGDCGSYFEHNPTSYNGDYLCTNCYENGYFTCETCGEVQTTDQYVDDGDCTNCCKSDGDCSNKAFRSNGKIERIQSRRHFGIELETSQCRGVSVIDGQTVFHSVTDGSISGLEFVSEQLFTDSGLDAITEFCEEANENNFAVDADCGFHLHIDAGNLDTVELHRLATAYYMTQQFWLSLVPESRRKNRYCLPLTWKLPVVYQQDSLERFREWADGLDRYRWCNLAAYEKHGTIEIRLHTASLDARKINCWVLAHMLFFEFAIKTPIDQLRRIFRGNKPDILYREVCKIWIASGSTDAESLCKYYAMRMTKFGTDCESYVVQDAEQVKEMAEQVKEMAEQDACTVG